MSRVVVERELHCVSDVRAIWAIVTDTDRMNRAVGMDKLELTPLSNGTAARYLVRTRIGGIPVEYEERPYEWVYLESFKVMRPMRSGPFKMLEMAFFLRPGPGGAGTTLSMRLTVDPRIALTGMLFRHMGKRTLDAFAHAAEEGDRAGKHRAFIEGERPQLHESALARAAAELAGTEHAAIAKKLVAFVREESDSEVSRVRPFELAARWGDEPRAVLGACLRAVRAGLLDLRWEVICPSCRTATEVLPTLASLGEHGACQLCELEFAVELDQAVEATFAANAAVRPTEQGPYCIGGPARTPHVIAQTILPARGEGTLFSPVEPGRYRLFVRGGAAAQLEVDAGAPSEVRLAASAVGASTEPIRIAPRGVLLLENASGEERHAKIERVTYGDLAARAQLVTTMPGFRRDFSADILRPGTALKIARVGLFFSDLTGSTQLYADAGDAAAFRLVHDHFDLVLKLIEDHEGTLVKTIGDAVMAVFADDVTGVVASVAILRAFEGFRRDDPVRLQTHIKLGVYGGPCYVVTANGVLDYFGQTVNVAARLQGEAKSGELVIEAALADRAIAAGRLDAGLVVERYVARPKGVPTPIAAARVRVASAPAVLERPAPAPDS